MSEQSAHLTVETWKAMRAAPRDHQALLAHLEAGCDQCDEFLATQVDEFDGVTDQALLSLAPVSEAPLDELGWRRLNKRLAQPPRRTALWAMGALAAAALLTVGGLALRHESGGWNGLKGSRGPALELAAARRKADNAFVRLDDGATLRNDSVLVFRATSTVDGPARVFLQRAHELPVEVGATELQAGTHELQNDTGLLGVTLEGEHGEVSVWVVAGETPFSRDAALSAIDSLGTPELGVARVKVHVE